MEPNKALIEAIARAIHQEFVYGADPDHYDDEDECLARAAYAAMVEQLELVEETRTLDDGMAGQVWTEGFPTWPDITIAKSATRQRRLVSPWQDVAP